MATFRYLEEKLLERLQGWKRRTLSWAAKEVLIKSVALALPLHVMSCFKLPLSLCRLLDKHVARFWWSVEEEQSKIRWVSWRNLCKSKHDGGMGFSRFEHFNQALLAKIGWQILNDPQSLLAQVYQGKYFPTGTFLTAQARSRPSWGWQSVLYGRELLEKGIRWQVGNGLKTSLLSSNWIPLLHPNPPQFNPLVLPVGGGLPVAEVIIPGEGRWDESKLNQWFDPPTCRAITTIPLPRGTVEDRLVWHDSADGAFSVKSAYHLAVRLDQCTNRWRATVSWMDRVSWIRLWGAKIPPKLKVFLWQIFNRALPTAEALREKDVEVHPRCPVCWSASETMEHLFLDCPVARALWDFAGLEHLGQGLPRQTFPLFLKTLMAIVHKSDLWLAVVAVLWRIWKSRNWVVFEGKQFGFPALMRQYHQQLAEWARLPADPGMGPVNPCPSRLNPVRSTSIVCMWDGATRRGSHSAGGIVVMTSAREILGVVGVQFQCIDDPLVVEVLALREALWWCLEHGFPMVQFEGDAKVVIDKINRAETGDIRMGAVLEEVVSCFASRTGFSVRFVGRRNNRVAHVVARKALSLLPSACRVFDFQAWLNSRM
ncbi:unnamed protein product [Linum trigynum]|uniref:Reverse transcriptase zinc-binding domain-containing protein n=1 Tax=Linum trigynum TaxID=586398 RepID=A0AAV2EFN2_9ROSI